MITRGEAVRRADAYLRERGSTWQAYAQGARPNPTQNLWIIEHRDPEHSGEPLMGGGLLVVPSQRAVYEIDSLPGAPEFIGMQTPAGFAGLPADWEEVVADFLDDFSWWDLLDWLDAERAVHEVYPPSKDVFAAFELTHYEETRVVIVGQDPYPRPGQAHGLSFSVPQGVSKPRALINIHKLLQTDLLVAAPEHGNLEHWARQGVLLLNTALSVRRGAELSHSDRWQPFTDAVIQAVSQKDESVVFILWGDHARAKKPLIDSSRHLVIESAHPTSRPGAKLPFSESRPFSEANEFLEGAGLAPITWA